MKNPLSLIRSFILPTYTSFTTATKSHNLERDDIQNCVKKIYNTFLHILASQDTQTTPSSSNNENNITEFYQICFRESQSWSDFEAVCGKSSADPDVKKNISEKIVDIRKLDSELRSIENNPSSANNDALGKAKMNLKGQLVEFSKFLSTIPIDNAADIKNYFTAYEKSLFLFYDNREVPMDVHHYYVKVLKHVPDKTIIIHGKHLDNCTKAIFIAKIAFERRKAPGYNVMIRLPLSIELEITAHLGTSPSTNTGKKTPMDNFTSVHETQAGDLLKQAVTLSMDMIQSYIQPPQE